MRRKPHRGFTLKVADHVPSNYISDSFPEAQALADKLNSNVVTKYDDTDIGERYKYQRKWTWDVMREGTHEQVSPQFYVGTGEQITLLPAHTNVPVEEYEDQ
jgi:hypothetical protein